MSEAPVDGEDAGERSRETPRGSDAVSNALIDAAAKMLSEMGPRAVSVREIAKRAGVNHGQVHHYFGSKAALLRAAMRRLAQEHFDNAMRRSSNAAIPPPLSLAEDRGYWRALCQLIMEGELDLAATEIDEGISVPRRAFDMLTREFDIAEDDIGFRARFATVVTLQLGWVVLEDYMMRLADVTDDRREELRAEVRRLLEVIADPTHAMPAK